MSLDLNLITGTKALERPQTSWQGGDRSRQRNLPCWHAWAPQTAGQGRSLSPPTPTWSCLPSSPFNFSTSRQSIPCKIWFKMFYFNIKVSLTHLMHPICSNPLLDKSVHLPHNSSPPVHSSLGLSTLAGVKGVQKCSFDHTSLLLHLLQFSQCSDWWLSPCVALRGAGGAGGCKENKYHS